MNATYPLMTTAQAEPYGVCCMDCDRALLPGLPYSERLNSLTIDGAPVVEIVCVYCAEGAA